LARSKLGVVAGAGVVAAVLLIGDPGAAVAVADRGGSISPHFGGGNRSDDGDKRGVLNRGGGGHRNLGGVFGGKRGIGGKLPDLKPDIPRTTVESKTSDTARDIQRAPRDKLDANSDNLGVSRENLAATTPRVGGSTIVVDRSASTGDDTAVPTVPAPPPALVGNALPPVTQTNSAADPPFGSVAPLEQAPSPAAAVVAPPPGPAPGSSPPRIHLPAVPYLDALHPDEPTDPFFGLAGLVLIPLVGAALGCRQARAAQAAAALGRT
jgi:hypothetical protein